MKIAFMMDRLESIEPIWETTSYLMYECNQRGHTVYFLEPHDIYIRGGYHRHTGSFHEKILAIHNKLSEKG